ncbi:MAG: class II aldolase/adducin family protein [Clostridia bacterium]|nr:class II aldolase/adducin family protein [Clostridia bacterium]
MEHYEQAARIVAFSKRMYEERLVSATSGNLSERIPGTDDVFAITPSSEDYLTMTPDRIVVMKTDGTLIYCPEGAKPSSEWRLHAAIYRDRKDVNAVVHTHSPYATAFATVGQSIPPALAEMLPWLGGGVPLAKYGPLGTWDLADNTSAAIGETGVSALMANHGAVAVAANMKTAYARAAYIEDAARVIVIAKGIGELVIPE